MSKLGIVIIGRNEGERLRRSLNAALGKGHHIVYVDSASTDGSVELAKEMGIDVVELDPSKPFASPRSRHEGFQHLIKVDPEIKYVQFIDGDCELISGWLERGVSELDARSDIAVVSGRRRERFPESSIYNRLADIEWDTPIGEVKYCHGDAMMRVAAYQQVGGFNPGLIGGGEPELCVRFRREGWKILRVDCEMTWHDADITRFSQWWKRNIRVGHAYAEGSWLQGRSPQRHWVKESRSIWFWGLVVPLIALVLAWPTKGLSLLLLLGYPILTYRIYCRTIQQRGLTSADAFLFAWTCVVAKFPLVQGQLKFHLNRLIGRQTKLVEYKDVSQIERDPQVTP
jgi:glycosyltransferase involved in cell wall biosynthesis